MSIEGKSSSYGIDDIQSLLTARSKKCSQEKGIEQRTKKRKQPFHPIRPEKAPNSKDETKSED
jgi:hypothetical protein